MGPYTHARVSKYTLTFHQKRLKYHRRHIPNKTQLFGGPQASFENIMKTGDTFSQKICRGTFVKDFVHSAVFLFLDKSSHSLLKSIRLARIRPAILASYDPGTLEFNIVNSQGVNYLFKILTIKNHIFIPHLPLP